VNRKASIAILELNASGVSVQPEELRRLNDRLTNAIILTRKFKVVERERLLDMIREFALSKYEFTDPKSAVRAGKMTGADFLVFGSVNDMAAGVVTKKNPYLSGVDQSVRYRLVGSVRVVDSRTGEIVAAWEERAEGGGEAPSERNTLGEGGFDVVQKAFAERIAVHLADAVYPPKVVQVNGDQIVLNRGTDGSFAVGDRIDVYRVGNVIKDADTGDTLGTNDFRIGTAVVKEVQPRMTVAVMEAGSDQVKIGMKVRSAYYTGRTRGKKAEPQPAPPKLNW
jgi:hypothetical protein